MNPAAKPRSARSGRRRAVLPVGFVAELRQPRRALQRAPLRGVRGHLATTACLLLADEVFESRSSAPRSFPARGISRQRCREEVATRSGPGVRRPRLHRRSGCPAAPRARRRTSSRTASRSRTDTRRASCCAPSSPGWRRRACVREWAKDHVGRTSAIKLWLARQLLRRAHALGGGPPLRRQPRPALRASWQSEPTPGPWSTLDRQGARQGLSRAAAAGWSGSPGEQQPRRDAHAHGPRQWACARWPLDPPVHSALDQLPSSPSPSGERHRARAPAAANPGRDARQERAPRGPCSPATTVCSRWVICAGGHACCIYSRAPLEASMTSTPPSATRSITRPRAIRCTRSSARG